MKLVIFMNIEIDDIKYELIEDFGGGFNLDEFKEKYTDYFYPYDYVVGDIAYSKLRLKGFYEDGSKFAKSYNNIKKLKRYIKENCAYGCKYFVLKKVADNRKKEDIKEEKEPKNERRYSSKKSKTIE